MAITLHHDITMNGKVVRAGETVSWVMVYPFFLFHMAVFGGSGFFMAYGTDVELSFLFAHGGIAIVVYLAFYWAIFGPDTVKWLFIDTALGVVGIVAQLGWILALFDKTLADYSILRHIVPFCYYVLYTFLVHRAVRDIWSADRDDAKRRKVDWIYVGASLLIYALLAL